MTSEPIETKPYEVRTTSKTLATFDTETDPFDDGVIPKPFTCGFWRADTGDYFDWWGDDCLDQFFTWLNERTAAGDRFLIYCHNLGGFDLHFMLDEISPGTAPTIINGRISVVDLHGQEFRDSYRIFPLALGGYQKEKIDYLGMFTRDKREEHREAILRYQESDCRYLGDLVTGFHATFGDRPTIGNTAINYLQSFHGFERMTPAQDQMVRPYFYGGRCQAFRVGVMPGAWRVVDVNSMYMSVMRDVEHPISSDPIIGARIGTKTAFVDWEGENMGCVPVRADDQSLDFRVTHGRFKSTIHEIRQGEATGTIRIKRVFLTLGYHRWGNFADFIDFAFGNRREAQANNDKINDLFWKLVGNSAYGKFAQDPRKYERYLYSNHGEGFPVDDLWHAEDRPNGFRPLHVRDEMVIWSKPAPNRWNGFFNCATGASITGAARAALLRGILAADGLAYCDTDSLICRDVRTADPNGTRQPTIRLDDSDLGAWKLEATGVLFACAGKKLYALFDDKPAYEKDGTEKESLVYEGRRLWCVKKAHKGAVLSAADILNIAGGGKVRYKSDRPNFKLDGTVEFVERVIERTG